MYPESYHKIERIPVVKSLNGSWSSWAYGEQGLLDHRVTEEEAQAYLIHHFFIEELPSGA